MSEEINFKAKSKKIKMLAIVAILVVIGATIVVVVLANLKNSTAKKVEKQLSLGQKYLSELDYEQAIAAYELAIEIEPMSVDAYLGLVDVYLAMGDYEKAEEVIGNAQIAITKEEDLFRIGKKAEEVRERKAAAEPEIPTMAPTPTPTPISTATPVPTPSVSLEEIRNAEIGDYVTYGTYEQDNDLTNGPEAIEWQVLDKTGGKLLVFSRYALDTKPYNEEAIGITWENCTLRSWVNNEFYCTAFSEGEREHILETVVVNESNSSYGTDGGNDTKDKVFLLSISEVINSFGNDGSNSILLQARRKLTEYAKAQGGWAYSEAKFGWGAEASEGYGNIFLRTPGDKSDAVTYINYYGGVSNYGCSVDDKEKAVCPAMWIVYEEQDDAMPTIALTPTPMPVPDHVIDWKDVNLEEAMHEITRIYYRDIMLSDVVEYTALNLYGYEISDISALAELTNLTELNVEESKISDISALANLTNLTVLNLGENEISDISALANLTNLTELSLGENEISDISVLANLTNLTELSLGGNKISDISALAGLTKLESLSLANNNISDISALAELKRLEYLTLERNGLSDISALVNLTNLTSLLVGENEINDISALEGLISLTWLILWDNKISDISALKNLTKLIELDLRSNEISDISALSKMIELKHLYLSRNKISDISSLAGLTKLENVFLERNDITDYSPVSHVSNVDKD